MQKGKAVKSCIEFYSFQIEMTNLTVTRLGPNKNEKLHTDSQLYFYQFRKFEGWN